ncbi:MAG: hypothetical protein ACFHWX_13770 [Bacteroidota bacterium]
MEHQETLLDKDAIIIGAISGEVYLDDLVKVGAYYRKKALELGYRLILDFSKGVNRVTISEAITYFERKLDAIDERFRTIPLSYVSSEQHYPFFLIMQQAWQNKGISVMVFKEMDAAIKWFEYHDLPEGFKKK